MSRLLILTRHAKSSWDHPTLSDHDRPLNKRGRKSAPKMAAWLRHHGWIPDEVISSSAARTRETWQRMGLKADKVRFQRRLYPADPGTILTHLSKATEQAVLMLGHNPGIADFANRIVEKAPDHPRFLDYPTCATSVIRFDIDKWADIQWHSGAVLGFAIPRELPE